MQNQQTNDNFVRILIAVTTLLSTIFVTSWWNNSQIRNQALSQPLLSSGESITMNRTQFESLVAPQNKSNLLAPTPVVIMQQPVQANQPSEVIVRSVATIQVPPTATPAVLPAVYPWINRSLPATVTVSAGTPMSDVPLSWMTDLYDIYEVSYYSLYQKVLDHVKLGKSPTYVSARFAAMRFDIMLTQMEKSSKPYPREDVDELFLWLEHAARGAVSGDVSRNEIMARATWLEGYLNKLNDKISLYRVSQIRSIANEYR